jgi:ubiquinone biosynthesis protein
MRSVIRGMGAKTDPKALFYQTQRLKVRFMRVVEAIERLIGARPGQKLEVNFRATTLETTIRRAGRRLALALTAGAAILATALTAVSDKVASWLPPAFGVLALVLTLGLVVDLVRRRQ